MPDEPLSQSQLFLYQTEDEQTRIQVRLEGETVWLSQAQMAELFQTSVPNVSMHIRNLFSEGELPADAVVKEFLITAADGKNHRTKFYNLDVVISVGYRVKSLRGTQFRIWATQRLREYVVKGFTMDDERLKKAGGGDYFDELLARIRDIRSSEKVFWRKVLDIYATSIDYDAKVDVSQKFFAIVQNKMHWAAHGHTVAEVVSKRADASQPNMGMMTFPGSSPKKADAGVAKNYLAEGELETLNLIVSLYLDFAALQAQSRKTMTIKDWISKLDDFLRLSDREILTHSGKVSHEAAQDFTLSGKRELYRGYTVTEINAESGFVSFGNGVRLRVSESQGGHNDAVLRVQVEETVREHFKKELALHGRPAGQRIKVLSLFFIDRVAHYAPADGKIRKWFVEAYGRIATEPEFAALAPLPVADLHNGYFAADKDGAKDSKEGKSTKADDEAYHLIMEAKEKLLAPEVPLRFIFSHSALREAGTIRTSFKSARCVKARARCANGRKSGAVCGWRASRTARAARMQK